MADKKKVGVLLSDSQLRSRYPSAGRATEICLPAESVLTLPSRVLAINYQYGGGIPYGKVLELYGEESTGKSLEAYDFAVACQSLGGLVLWADAEASFDARWAKKNGLNLDKTYLLPDENEIETISDWQADMLVYARAKLTNNEPILLVIDSTAALETRDNIAAADTDSGEDMGRRSKKIYQMLRKRNKLYAKYGACVIYINQLRQKPVKTKFEDPDTTPGGKAMRYYAGIRCGLYGGKFIKDSAGKKVGRFVYVRIKKNKVSEPRENIQAQVFFKEYEGKMGYSKYWGLPQILVDEGVVKYKRNAGFYYKGKRIATGNPTDKPEKFVELLEKDEVLRRKLLKRVPINTISKTRERIEAITKNLYPVKNAKKEKSPEE